MSCTFWIRRKKKAALLKAQAEKAVTETVAEKPEEKAVAESGKRNRNSKSRTAE